MTATSTKARPGAPIDRLYVADDELPEKIGVDAATLGTFIRQLDRNPKSGFPKQDPQLGNRRYWPAVRVWFDKYNRMPPDRPV
jgi:hypothetical protein